MGLLGEREIQALHPKIVDNHAAGAYQAGPVLTLLGVPPEAQ